MHNKTDISAQVAQWLNYMQKFDFRIEHRPGSTNQLEDTQSWVYKNIPDDQIDLEEWVDEPQDTEEVEFSKEYLNTIEIPNDEELQQELDNESEEEFLKTY